MRPEQEKLLVAVLLVIVALFVVGVVGWPASPMGTDGWGMMGFDFPFYGGLFDAVRVSTDGWLSFSSTDPSPVHQPVPCAGTPENLVAPFWTDLDFGGAARAVYERDWDSFTVQFTEVRRAVPPYVSAAIAKAIEKLPADRFGSAKEFRAALQNQAFTHQTRLRPAPSAAGPRSLSDG